MLNQVVILVAYDNREQHIKQAKASLRLGAVFLGRIRATGPHV